MKFEMKRYKQPHCDKKSLRTLYSLNIHEGEVEGLGRHCVVHLALIGLCIVAR